MTLLWTKQLATFSVFTGVINLRGMLGEHEKKLVNHQPEAFDKQLK